MDWSRQSMATSGRRRLAVLPLLAAAALLLAGCSSGGSSDSPSGGTSATSEQPSDLGSSPPEEGTEQPSAGETKTAEPNGGFKNGPRPSANFSGQWPDVINVNVQNTTGAAYDAQLEIRDCTPGQPAQQKSTHISVATGESYDKTFSFTARNPRIPTHQVCGTLVQDGGGPVTTFSEAIDDPGASTTESPDTPESAATSDTSTP